MTIPPNHRNQHVERHFVDRLSLHYAYDRAYDVPGTHRAVYRTNSNTPGITLSLFLSSSPVLHPGNIITPRAHGTRPLTAHPRKTKQAKGDC